MKHKHLFKNLVAVLLMVAAGQGSVWAQTFTITASHSNDTTTFTITRSGSSLPAQTINYRTVNLSAYAGQHYTAVSGTYTFPAGIETKTVKVAESTPSTQAYKYQNTTQRSYRFEVLDINGFELASQVRNYSTGTQFSTDKVSKEITDLVYFNGTSYASGLSSSKYLDVNFTPSSDSVQGSKQDLPGYVLIDDSYDYRRKWATVSTSNLINSTNASASYLKNIGYKIYATVCFTEKERDDGYQYVQIVAGAASHAFDGADSNGKVNYNHPNNAVYTVCYELADGSNSEGKAFFPHRYNCTTRTSPTGCEQSSTHTEFYLATGRLWQQKYKSTSYKADNSGSVVLDPDVSYITTRFDAGGEDNDTWGYKDLFVRMALCDATAPTLYNNSTSGITVSAGPYLVGNTFYISVPFSEIVTTASYSNNKKLVTTWGDATYASGDGTNVITFKGTITADAGTTLKITSVKCNFKDPSENYYQGLGISNYTDSFDKTFSGVTCSATYTLAATNTAFTIPSGDYWVSDNDHLPQPHPSTFYFYKGIVNTTNQVSLAETTDYTMSWSNNTAAGIGTATATGAGSYTGSVSTTFPIRWSTYTVAFNKNGSTGIPATGTMENQNFTYATAQNLTANAFSRTGYTFAGWNTAPDGSGDSYADGASVSNLTPEDGGTVVLYAQWTAIPWAGTGNSADDPYIITYPSQLDLLSDNLRNGVSTYYNKFFRLDADIVYENYTSWYDFNVTDHNFNAIGTSTYAFQGTFDGNSHTISGIRIYMPNDDYQGLFGYIDGANIMNVTLTDARISGKNYVGGLVGKIEHGMIQNSLVYTAAIKANNSVGAVVGYKSYGTISHNYYQGCIVEKGNFTYTTGIGLGNPLNDFVDEVVSLHALTLPVDVTASGESVVIDADTYYAHMGTVTLTYTGDPGYSVSYSYNDGSDHAISGHSFTMPGTDVTISRTLTPRWGVTSGHDGTTEATAYLISDTTDLNLLARYVNGTHGYAANNFEGKYFKLANNITYSHEGLGATESNYTAIGGYFNGGDKLFWGTFDGQGDTVSGIRIYKGGATYANGYQGLFGEVYGTIKNVTLTDAVITGRENVGGIVGYISINGITGGNIENCHVTGSVILHAVADNAYNHGGIVGKVNSGSVSGCTSAATLTYADGRTNCELYGGIVGNLNGSLQNCLVLGANVSGTNYVGAVAGMINNNYPYAANYYRGCTVGGTVDATNVGIGSEGGSTPPKDIDGIRSLHTLTLGTDITATGSETKVIGDVTYYASASTVTLSYGGTPALGYSHSGYSYHSSNQTITQSSNTLTMPAADLTVSATFTPITYNITYDLADGYLPSGQSNPDSYTIETPDFTLVNPVRTGYSFAGWTGGVNSELSTPTSDLTVALGSTGNRTYTANWTPVWGQQNGANGSSTNPYLISDTLGLNMLARNVNGTHGYNHKDFQGNFFKLANDITYSYAGLGATESNYTPIGGVFNSNDQSFYGTFDGDGHTVSGIRIYRGGVYNADGYLGLFGNVSDGTVKNVTLSDADITGYKYVGGIVGMAADGVTVRNCHVTASVALHAVQQGAYNFGGIVAYLHSHLSSISLIDSCTSAASLTVADGLSGCDAFGGIVGYCHGTVQNCLVIGASVPELRNFDNYNNSYDGSGAIIGSLYNNNNCILSHNYYHGVTIGSATSGIGIGRDTYNTDHHDTIANDGTRPAFTLTLGTDISATATAAATYQGTDYYTAGTEVTLSYSGTVPTGYRVVYSYNDGTDHDITGNTFSMPDADATVSATVDVIPWTGSGSEDDPYIILYRSQLDLLATRVNNGNNFDGYFFKLANDIAYSYDGLGATESNYTPIGGVFNSSYNSFLGIFDGDGHTVSGIRIYRGGNDYHADSYLGLFGFVQGTVKNLTLSDADITGYSQVGGIAGMAMAGYGDTIRNCHVTASVALHAVQQGAYDFGGIVGKTQSSDHPSSPEIYVIDSCTSAATLTVADGLSGCSNFGGIAGHGLGTIQNSLVIGASVPTLHYTDQYNDLDASGAITGRFYRYQHCTLSHNYYRGVTIGSATSGIGIGNDNHNSVRFDSVANDGTRALHTLTLGTDIGTTTAAALTYLGTDYYTAGTEVTLSYSGTVPTGYRVTYSYQLNTEHFTLNTNILTMPEADVTVSATFTPITYTITYDLADGALPSGLSNPDSYTIETPDFTLVNPVRLGYVFAGWTGGVNSELSTPTSDLTIAQGTTGDRTYTANWTDVWNITGGADGSEEHPYLITTTAGLDLLAHNVNGTHGHTANDFDNTYFKLGADISYPHTTDWDDATSTENNYTAIGAPVNTGGDNWDYNPFNGTFDGDGHTVSGIRIYKGGSTLGDDHQGLFGATEGGTTIKNVTLSDTRITGKAFVGGIVGYSNGTIENCHVGGNVVIHAVVNEASGHGGIVGNANGGLVSGCTSAATISIASGLGNCSEFGGIAGTSGGRLQNCLVLGATVSGNNYVGAIVGYHGGGTLSHNYYHNCTVTINGDSFTYSIGRGGPTRGDVTDGNSHGAVKAQILNLGENVTATPAADLTYNNNYYYRVNTTVTLGTEGYTLTGGYTVMDAQNNPVALTDGNTFTMPASDVTATVNGTLTAIPWSGSGTESDPYIIIYRSQLDLLAERVNSGTGDSYASNGYSGKYFKLGADISYPHTTAWDDATSTENNYTAIGNSSRSFSGTFDGDGHTVSGIRIYKDGTTNADSYQGLFGNILTATVKNLILSDARITGYRHIGGIVGRFDRDTVQNCYVIDAAITGTAYTGAVAGYKDNGLLSHNYYHNCIVNVGGTTYTFGIGLGAPQNDFVNEVNPVYAITLTHGITTSPAAAFVYNAVRYYTAGTTVTLSAEGYTLTGDYTVMDAQNNVVALTGGNTFTMPANDVTVSAHLDLIDWTGSGTESDPYIILYRSQLDLLATRVNNGNNYNGKFFKLGADIAYDPNVLDANGENYTAIGGYFNGSNRYFRGTFDGDGHTVSGIRIHKTGETDDNRKQGLFGYISGATIKNIVLSDAQITGYALVGGIAGDPSSSSNTIQNCLVLNSQITVTSNSDNKGVIAGYYNNAITLTGNYYHNCTVNGVSTNVGAGGSDRDGAHAVYSLTLGTDIGTTTAAAVTYDNTDYYTTDTEVTLSYSGTVPTGFDLGYTVSYPLHTTHYTLPTNILTMPAADVTVGATFVAIPWTGSGNSEDDPYIIIYPSQLDLLARHVNGTDGYTANDYSGKFFRLGADIEYSYTTAWNDSTSTENNYTPIGGDFDGNKYFRGTFDGQGHTVSGIRIYRNARFVGLFGLVENGTVKNVTLADSRIAGGKYSGGIVGNNSGTVENCHVAATVALYAHFSGSNDFGGIVGNNGGVVRGCTSAATVSRNGMSSRQDYGGIVGTNTSFGTVENCLALGATVSANGNYGPVVGYKNPSHGTITNCHYRDCNVNNASQTDLYTVSGATDVTVAPSGTLTVAYPYNGIEVYGNAFYYGGTLYATEGAILTLDYTGTVPDGFDLGYTVSYPLPTTHYPLPTNILTMPAADVTAGAIFIVPYIDADGNPQTRTDYTLITGSNGDVTYGTAGQEGWFVVSGDVTVTGKLILQGSSKHLILCDGATLTVTNSGEWNTAISSSGSGSTLAIYGQANGTGTLNASVTGNQADALFHAGNLFINGGHVNTTVGENTSGVYCIEARNNLTINGGSVHATGSSGVYPRCLSSFSGDIILGWRSLSDRIYATFYDASGSVIVKAGQRFTDGTAVYSGTLTSAQVTAISGQTLQPCFAITLPEHVTATGVVCQNGTTAYAIPDATVTLAYAGYDLTDVTVNNNSNNQAITQSGNTFTMPAADVTVSATFTPITYTITYDLDGGSVASANPATYTIETPDFTLVNPTREGYTFTGWTGGVNSELSTPTSNLTIVQGTTGDLSYTAHWRAHIPYIDADGTLQSCTDYTLIESSSETMSHYPSPSGGGWFVVDGDVTAINVNFHANDAHLILKDGATLTINRLSTQDVSLSIYGQSLGTGTINGGRINVSSSNNDSYNLTVNGGTLMLDVDYTAIQSSGNVIINRGTVTATTTANEYTVYASDNITINGGTVTAINIGNAGGSLRSQNGDITINGGIVTATAQAGRNAIIAGNNGGGTNPGCNNLNLNWTDPTDRFSFSSYVGNVRLMAGKAFVDENGTLYYVNRALFGYSSLDHAITGHELTPFTDYDRQYSITYDPQGGTMPASYPTTYTYTSTVTLPVPTREDYTFLGWNLDGIDAPITVLEDSMYMGDLSLYAVWAPLYTDVTYLDENGTQQTVQAKILYNTFTTFEGGVYTVTEGTYFPEPITFTGNTTLILPDGMYFGTDSVTVNGNLTVYGQEVGYGYMTVGTVSTTGNIAIHGAVVHAYESLIAGGGNGTITLNWTGRANQRIAQEYRGQVNLVRGFYYQSNNGRTILRARNNINTATINGKELHPLVENTNVYYLDENGTRHTADATVLWGDETGTLPGGVYTLMEDKEFTHGLTFGGNTTLVLPDGVDLSLHGENGENNNYLSGNGITVNGSLAVYGQLNRNGSIGIRATGDAIHASGHVTVSNLYSYLHYSNGIYSGGNIIIAGGHYESSRTYAAGTVTLGYLASDDEIESGTYSSTVTVREGQTLWGYNTGYFYSGTLSNEAMNNIAGDVLIPCILDNVSRTVEGYNGNENGGWVFLASPVLGSIKPDNVNNMTNGFPDLYRYNTGTNVWENYHRHNSQNDPFTLDNGRGYLYARSNTETLTFYGAYNTGSSQAVTLEQGFNLVGNPFDAAATIDRPCYKMNAAGNGLVACATGTSIAVCEGVMVYSAADGQSVTFSRTAPSSKGSLNLTLGNADGHQIDNAVITLGGTDALEKLNGFNSQFSIFNSPASLSIPQGSHRYAVASVPESAKAVDVTFDGPAGDYTISIRNEELGMRNYLHLIDRLTGADVDLLQDSTYAFTATVGMPGSAPRFLIKLAPSADLSTPTSHFAHQYGDHLVITGSGLLTAYDALGRELFSQQLNAEHSTLNTAIFPQAGVYVLRLNTNTQKIVIK